MDFNVRVTQLPNGRFRATATVDGATYNGEANHPGYALIELGDYMHANMRQKSDLQTILETVLEK